jgi:hypothetical protein
MALFVRKFDKMFKKSGFFNKNKDKDKIKTKRTSKRPCFGYGKEGHFIAECPNVRVRRRDTNKNDKNKKKEVGEAHLGENGIQMMIALTPTLKRVMLPYPSGNQSTSHHSLKISPMMKMTSPTLASWLGAPR